LVISCIRLNRLHSLFKFIFRKITATNGKATEVVRAPYATDAIDYTVLNSSSDPNCEGRKMFLIM
jgi:hypothetical protein